MAAPRARASSTSTVHGGGGALDAVGRPGRDRRRGRLPPRAWHHPPAWPASSPRPLEEMAAALRATATARSAGAVLGAHLEGPFLNPARAGAHDPRHLLAPDLAMLRAAAGGCGRRRRCASSRWRPSCPAELDLMRGRDCARARWPPSATPTRITAAARAAFDAGASPRHPSVQRDAAVAPPRARAGGRRARARPTSCAS